MKKIGIVGGVGWLATVDYYTEICRRSEGRRASANPDGLPSPAEMSIESLDHSKAVSFIGVDGSDASWSRFDDYHRAALLRLEASGAEVALIASNAAHHRFDAIVAGVRIPVINIFEAVVQECVRLKATQVLILGTALTMESAELRKRFARRGVEALGPQDPEAKALTARLSVELLSGAAESAAERIGEIARSSFKSRFAGQPVVCLSCTELPLAFPEYKTQGSFAFDGMTYVNSSAVHIAAVLNAAGAE